VDWEGNKQCAFWWMGFKAIERSLKVVNHEKI
jgi:hypothetical protein